jgi:chemotaxis protein MotB
MMLVAGCNDPKDQEIAALQEENTRLTDELASARMAADANLQDAEEARRRYSDAQAEIENLRAVAAQQSAKGDGWQEVPGGARISLASGILFASGKTEIKNSAKATLDRVATDILTTYAGKEIFVFGHTDNTPIRKSGWKDNFELSVQRALAIVRYLQSKGVPGARLVAAGCGEFRPEVPNASPTDQARNRRVEIFAVEPKE